MIDQGVHELTGGLRPYSRLPRQLSCADQHTSDGRHGESSVEAEVQPKFHIAGEVRKSQIPVDRVRRLFVLSCQCHRRFTRLIRIIESTSESISAYAGDGTVSAPRAALSSGLLVESPSERGVVSHEGTVPASTSSWPWSSSRGAGAPSVRLDVVGHCVLQPGWWHVEYPHRDLRCPVSMALHESSADLGGEVQQVGRGCAVVVETGVPSSRLFRGLVRGPVLGAFRSVRGSPGTLRCRNRQGPERPVGPSDGGRRALPGKSAGDGGRVGLYAGFCRLRSLRAGGRRPSI